jgi:hypothetical protein
MKGFSERTLLSGLFEGRVRYSAGFTATRVDIALGVAAERLRGRSIGRLRLDVSMVASRRYNY